MKHSICSFTNLPSEFYTKRQISTKLSSVAMSRFRSLLLVCFCQWLIAVLWAFWLITKLKCALIQWKNNDTKDYSENNGNFWTANLTMRAKIVNQSSDFPVCRTGSYRHKKKALATCSSFSTGRSVISCQCKSFSSSVFDSHSVTVIRLLSTVHTGLSSSARRSNMSKTKFNRILQLCWWCLHA